MLGFENLLNIHPLFVHFPIALILSVIPVFVAPILYAVRAEHKMKNISSEIGKRS